MSLELSVLSLPIIIGVDFETCLQDCIRSAGDEREEAVMCTQLTRIQGKLTRPSSILTKIVNGSAGGKIA